MTKLYLIQCERCGESEITASISRTVRKKCRASYDQRQFESLINKVVGI